MNPSSPGWIEKYLQLIDHNLVINERTTPLKLYDGLRSLGFMYGLSDGPMISMPKSTLLLTSEEHTKLNLFHALFVTYLRSSKKTETEDALEHILQFYKDFEKGKASLLQKLSIGSRQHQLVEKKLAARLLESNTISKENPTSFLAYALLFVDIIAFENYLKDADTFQHKTIEFESAILTCCLLALKAKNKKNKYDNKLIELLESSTAYTSFALEEVVQTGNEITTMVDHLSLKERMYLLDISCLAVWGDQKIDSKEQQFLEHLTSALQLGEEQLTKAIQSIHDFTSRHSEEIELFSYKHPVKQLYNQSIKTVRLLILRNKDRLVVELIESKELLILLSKSTLRDLTKEEKKKVKEQLLDICKTVPSLTIFLLPGGTLLLPLLVKLIPKLLPSAFNENRIEDTDV